MNNGMGVHILVNLLDCPKDKLENLENVRNIALEAVDEAELSLIKHEFHQFKPTGVTGFFLLAESHLSIHTWPELGSVAVDIFCCYLTEDGKEQATLKAEKACDALIRRFQPKDINKKVILR